MNHGEELEILRLCCGSSAALSEPIDVPDAWRCTVATGDLEGIDVDHFDVVLIDTRGTDADADRVQELVRKMGMRVPRTRWLLLVDKAMGCLASSAVEAGVWDLLEADEVGSFLRDRIAGAARLRRLHRAARSEARAKDARDEEEQEPLQMVGTSPAIRSIFSLIRRVAASDVPVLITGESGTGKELAAVAIHERSQRADKPFVPINCGAIPETLLESELFGHEKGAFTGAAHQRKGRFEAADGGTIFLDEVGDLPPLLQVKLLRFLQDHVVERVGGTTGIHLNVRVIAATNRDIDSMTKRGDFREDLLFRLGVLLIQMPPLCERDDDVVLMARFFLKRYAKEEGRSFRGFSRAAVETMLQHRWPGNVRELINRVRRAVVIADGAVIGPVDLGLEAAPVAAPMLTLRAARRDAELRSLRTALLRANGKKAEAAKLLGISRTQLYELMGRHHLAVQDPLCG